MIIAKDVLSSHILDAVRKVEALNPLEDLAREPRAVLRHPVRYRLQGGFTWARKRVVHRQAIARRPFLAESEKRLAISHFAPGGRRASAGNTRA